MSKPPTWGRGGRRAKQHEWGVVGYSDETGEIWYCPLCDRYMRHEPETAYMPKKEALALLERIGGAASIDRRNPTFRVTVTQGRIKPRGGVEGPFERSFTVVARTARGAVKAVRDAGIPVDSVRVERVNPVSGKQEKAASKEDLMESILHKFLEACQRPLKEPTKAQLRRWAKMHRAFGIVTEAERTRAWRRGSVI